METDKVIFREERLEEIYKLLKSNQKVYVADLARTFAVSPSSIRLDLVELESRGLIRRTYGGAILPSAGEVFVEPLSELSQRSKLMRAEKEAIGKLAVTLIGDGDSLMIDGGSTTLQVAKNLYARRNLMIVTNSISFLPDLLEIKDAVVYLVGGMVYRENGVLVGDIANNITASLHPKKAILGIDGISLKYGFTTGDPSVPAEASIKR